MKNKSLKRDLKPIEVQRQTPEDKQLARFVAEHPDLAGKALAKWLKDNKENKS